LKVIKGAKRMPDPAKDRAAEAVEECWVAFENAGSKRRKFPSREFRAFVKAARYYIEITNGDPLIHRVVAKSLNDLRWHLDMERKLVPGDVLYETDRLETQLYAGYDPYFYGNEPPGL
jgi:hypothetical protein